MKRHRTIATCLTIAALVFTGSVAEAGARSSKHDEYAETLWQHLHNVTPYSQWTAAETPVELPCAPPATDGAKSYLNPVAASGSDDYGYGSVIVTEQYAGDELLGVTACVRVHEDFDARNDDWYWIHYLADGTVVQTSADKAPYAKRGFVTLVEDGRLWVFYMNSPEFAEFHANGELAKHAIVPAAGPAGMTIKSPDQDTILAYLAAKPGFATFVEDGRVWVFDEESEALADYKQSGEPAKSVTWPASGPLGCTLKSAETDTLQAYVAAKEGFVTKIEDGRIWIFFPDSEELAAFEKMGELAKHVIRPGVGPRGMTLKAPDADVMLAYIAARDGFVTKIVDERIWVFRPGSQELAEYEEVGELAKHVIRPGAGPLGITVKAPDSETLERYLIVASQ